MNFKFEVTEQNGFKSTMEFTSYDLDEIGEYIKCFLNGAGFVVDGVSFIIESEEDL